MLYFFAHQAPQFIIGLHNLSSGYTIYHRVTEIFMDYAILAPGYKF